MEILVVIFNQKFEVLQIIFCKGLRFEEITCLFLTKIFNLKCFKIFLHLWIIFTKLFPNQSFFFMFHVVKLIGIQSILNLIKNLKKSYSTEIGFLKKQSKLFISSISMLKLNKWFSFTRKITLQYIFENELNDVSIFLLKKDLLFIWSENLKILLLS